MPRTSAGLLLYRRRDSGVEVLIGHMGGPFWARKDDAAWSVPKGEYDAGRGAVRGRPARVRGGTRLAGPGRPSSCRSGEVKQAGGKVLTVWAAEGDLDAAAAHSNTFPLEWPPRSGRMQEFPEIDRAAWLRVDEARTKLVRGQVPLLDRLLAALADPG